MSDLMTQLREYGNQLDEMATPLSELANDAPPLLSPVPSRRRGWMAAPAAAVAVLMLIGGTVWLFGRPGRDVVDQPGVTVLVEPEPVSTLAESITATTELPDSNGRLVPFTSDLVASRVRFDERTFGNAVMSSVVPSGVGFVAVGVSVDGSRRDGLVWVSPDGLAWTRISEGQDVFNDVHLNSVAAYGEGLVAVGTYDSGTDVDPVVWLSDDGLAWDRVPDSDSALGGAGDQIMVSVASFGGGLVAVGESFSFSQGTEAAVWTSSDGTRWSRVALEGPMFEDSIMIDVTAFGDLLVAVGVTFSDSGPDAAVWTSTDAINWTRIAHDPSVFGGNGDQTMTSVTSSNGRLTAVGYDQIGLGDAAVWTSTDANTWTRIPHNEFVFGGGEDGGAEMTSVEAYGGGFVVGGLQQTAGDMDALMWLSPDGLAWERIITDSEVFGGRDQQWIASLAVGGKTVVAVGFVGPFGVHLDTDLDGVVWTLSP